MGFDFFLSQFVVCVKIVFISKGCVSQDHAPNFRATWIHQGFMLAPALIIRFVHIMLVISVSHWTGTKIALVWSSRAPDVIGSGDVISWMDPSFLYG